MNLNDIFKVLVWDTLVKRALSDLFMTVPLFSVGPLGYVITWLTLQLTDRLYIFLKAAIDIEVIALRNDELKKQYAVAAVKLKLIAKKNGVNSEEFKEAREENQKALSSFVQFNPG